MKILDQTPLVDEKGELGFSQRLQGILQFGLNWPVELKAQQVIINYLDRNFEKGYTLIRNQALGQSGIIIPIILIGTAGIFAINITHLRGRYEAAGDQWNVESKNEYKPAHPNLIQETATMARALTVFIERQGYKLPTPVEPTLIAAEPGLYIQSSQPAIKVLMSDGIRTFVTGLKSSAPVLRADIVLDLADRIVNPRQARAQSAAKAMAPTLPPAASFQQIDRNVEPQAQAVSRARAIFAAADDVKPFDASNFEFALEEDEAAAQAAADRIDGISPSESTRKPRRIFNLTLVQIVALVALALIFCCVLATFGYVFYMR
ncbi:MAG: hypothetical protein OZ914_08695 [Anaerolineaceae bacterium]|jgi:hypothetical protein|nr:hypothetical protein [Anaerolineaceae bacterium]OQY89940.1 MAG: hypothetical protein B6D38_05070 [Anaerolineae bacterium UTCFX1]